MLHPSLTLSSAGSASGRDHRSVRWSGSADRPPATIGVVRRQRTRWLAIAAGGSVVGAFDRVDQAANALRMHLVSPALRVRAIPAQRPPAAATEDQVPARGRPLPQTVATPGSPLLSPPPWADQPT